jgi:lysozyme
MKTTPDGRAFIEVFEGLSLKAYWDATGRVWTIGYGHTSVAGPPRVYQGMVITRDVADQVLGADLASVEIEVLHFIKVPLTQNQFDALVSFQFNTGWLGKPTCSLTHAINAGKLQLADEDFMLYDRSGGEVLSGLVRRRHGEAVMFAGNTKEALQIAGARMA